MLNVRTLFRVLFKGSGLTELNHLVRPQNTGLLSLYSDLRFNSNVSDSLIKDVDECFQISTESLNVQFAAVLADL